MEESHSQKLFGEFWKLLAHKRNRDKGTPLNGELWTFEVDRWRLAVNGGETEQDHVPPFSVMIWFNGWPAGVLDPGGGLVAAGRLANFDTLIEAMRQDAAKATA